MTETTLYIAGPMTGHQNANRVEFFLAGARLRAAGFRVLNPANWPDGLSRREYMRLDLPMVLQADGLAVLAGFEASPGAFVETTLAEYCGLPIRTVEEWLSRSAPRPRVLLLEALPQP
jgi:hypothetical protein